MRARPESGGSGGIVGMGETRAHRAVLVARLTNLDPYSESVPIINRAQIDETPLTATAPLGPFEFAHKMAVARITMPKTVRPSAGRE